MALTIKRIARARRWPGRYHDKEGLYLQVSPGGASWLLRYERDGQERWMGLGSLKATSLEEAREAVTAAHKQLKAGIDPIYARRAERAAQRAATEAAKAATTTFTAAARLYAVNREREGKGTRYDGTFLRVMSRYAFPLIGALPVGAVDTVKKKGGATRPARGPPRKTLRSAGNA
jgi:hypothetical protein